MVANPQNDAFAVGTEQSYIKRWTTEEFQTLGDMGVFEGRHVELLEGEIYEMTSGTPHFTAVMKCVRALERAFDDGFHARPQGPLNIGKNTDPEPDVAVVVGAIEDYAAQHPTTAVLVVEVSDATLRHDQTKKSSLYARAQIQELWILNLKARKLEVHRAPFEDANALHGWSYSDIRVLEATESIAPLSALQSPVNVVDLLP